MKFAKVRDVKSPIRGTDKSAGIDFFIPNDYPGSIFLARGQAVSIPSGIHAKIPEGFALIAMNKSGVATQKYLQVGACVVDEDYQGEIHIHVTNVGNDLQELNPGDKLVQFLLIPVIYPTPEEVKDLESLYSGEVTQRGEGGFGSTNKTYKKGEIVEFRPMFSKSPKKFEVLEEFSGAFINNQDKLKEVEQ